MERLSTSGAKAAITASSIVPRISPSVPSRLRWVCMDLAALRRAFASSLPSGEASERRGKGGVFTRTGFGVDHFGGGSEPGEGNFVAFDGVKADGRIGSKLHAVKAELADGRRNSRGLRLLRAVDSMKLRHDEAPSFLKRVYDVFLCSKKRTRALPVPEACPGGARVRGGRAPGAPAKCCAEAGSRYGGGATASSHAERLVSVCGAWGTAQGKGTSRQALLIPGADGAILEAKARFRLEMRLFRVEIPQPCCGGIGTVSER